MAEDAPAAAKPERLLFTPGPLTTSATVKQAMLRDVGSRDGAFLEVVRGVRRSLCALGGAEEPAYAVIPMQGSGTFGVEAMLGSAIGPDGKLLVVDNGAYGARMAAIARTLGIRTTTLPSPEDAPASAAAVDAALAADSAVTHVAMVHLETSTGMVNPLEAVGEVVRARGRSYLVDAMSSFGGIPLSVPGASVDFLVSSANKCLEGVPGFSFVVARRAALLATRGFARSYSLDLLAQLEGLEASGQFRFTPPTHALLACERALAELSAEGGVPARAARYQANHAALVAGMCSLGFRTYLAPEHQGHIITSFHSPTHPSYGFTPFYERLAELGFVIYPGKVSRADCFRIGTIGRLAPRDLEALVGAVRQVLLELGVPLPISER